MTAWKKPRSRPARSSSKHRTGGWRWWQWLLVLLGIAGVCAGLVWWQLRASLSSFSNAADLSFAQLLQLYRDSAQTVINQTDGITNILLLGTDELEYRDVIAPLTDTIIILSINWEQERVVLLPLPRDIYLPGQGGKINSIYSLAYQQEASRAGVLTATQFSQLLELPLHYQLVVSLADVADFLELVGGVDVEIKQSFTDYQFPRSGVDIRVVTDPALLYETISFEAGPAHLDPEQALKFMRSRHGEGNEGNDYARSARQQQVLASVGQAMGTILREQLYRFDFTFLGELYAFYQSHFASQLSFTQALAIAQRLLGTKQQLPQVVSAQLAVDPGTAGANLRERTRPDWRLEVVSLEGLIKEVHEKLQLPGSDS